jgi:hypothetical protein
MDDFTIEIIPRILIKISDIWKLFVRIIIRFYIFGNILGVKPVNYWQYRYDVDSKKEKPIADELSSTSLIQTQYKH